MMNALVLQMIEERDRLNRAIEAMGIEIVPEVEPMPVKKAVTVTSRIPANGKQHERAKELLPIFLGRGPVRRREIVKSLRAIGISESTAHFAALDMGVLRFDGDKGQMWAMPGCVPPAHPVSKQPQPAPPTIRNRDAKRMLLDAIISTLDANPTPMMPDEIKREIVKKYPEFSQIKANSIRYRLEMLAQKGRVVPVGPPGIMGTQSGQKWQLIK